MTELLSLPEELISWEFDGQAIIATGTLLTSLGQVAGCRAEYQHGTVAQLSTNLKCRTFCQCEVFFFEASKQGKKKKKLFILRSFLSFYTIFKAKIPLGAESRHFCNVLIRVTALHIVPGTFGQSYCYAITLDASACAAVSEDNWVLRFEAQGSSYFLIRVLYNVTRQKVLFSCSWNRRASGWGFHLEPFHTVP